MTREEAYEIADKLSMTDLKEFTYTELVKTIYDDFESRTCDNCTHHTEATKHYGNCTRNGTPTPTEYNWFCAGFEKKD